LIWGGPGVFMKDDWYLYVIIGVLLIIIINNIMYTTLLSNKYEEFIESHIELQIIILDNRERIKELEKVNSESLVRM
jgi:ribose/xylose/arabinose/galactoside ABC-type transport system permease subunit